jgi:dephospho-CoA kinase
VKLIGVTGGIGSGKSTICKVLQVLGFPVFYSDTVAKELMEQDVELKNQIIALLGKDAYLDGALNRPFIASLIFANPNLKNALNQLVHPAVYRAFERFVNTHQSESLIFNESALLIETGSYKRFDKNMLVVADEEVRIKRVVNRDKTDANLVRARMENQLPDIEKMKYVDAIITNNDDSKVLEQVLEVLNEL